MNNGVVFDQQILDNEKLKLHWYYWFMPVGYKAWLNLSGKNRKYTYFTIMHSRVQYTIINQYLRENVVKLVTCLLFRVFIYISTFYPEEKKTKNRIIQTKFISVTLENPKKNKTPKVNKQLYLKKKAIMTIKKLGLGVVEDLRWKFCDLSRLAANKKVTIQNKYTLYIMISSQNSYIFWNPYTYKFCKVSIGLCGALYTYRITQLPISTGINTNKVSIYINRIL